MKLHQYILAVSAAAAMCASPALAQSYYHSRIGNFDTWTGPNGYYGTGSNIGGFYNYRDNYGTWNGSRIGNFDTWTFTPNPRYGW